VYALGTDAFSFTQTLVEAKASVPEMHIYSLNLMVLAGGMLRISIER
jgi:hypothetical protein